MDNSSGNDPLLRQKAVEDIVRFSETFVNNRWAKVALYTNLISELTKQLESLQRTQLDGSEYPSPIDLSPLLLSSPYGPISCVLQFLPVHVQIRFRLLSRYFRRVVSVSLSLRRLCLVEAAELTLQWNGLVKFRKDQLHRHGIHYSFNHMFTDRIPQTRARKIEFFDNLSYLLSEGVVVLREGVTHRVSRDPVSLSFFPSSGHRLPGSSFFIPGCPPHPERPCSYSSLSLVLPPDYSSYDVCQLYHLCFNLRGASFAHYGSTWRYFPSKSKLVTIELISIEDLESSDCELTVDLIEGAKGREGEVGEGEGNEERYEITDVVVYRAIENESVFTFTRATTIQDVETFVERVKRINLDRGNRQRCEIRCLRWLEWLGEATHCSSWNPFFRLLDLCTAMNPLSSISVELFAEGYCSLLLGIQNPERLESLLSAFQRRDLSLVPVIEPLLFGDCFEELGGDPSLLKQVPMDPCGVPAPVTVILTTLLRWIEERHLIGKARLVARLISMIVDEDSNAILSHDEVTRKRLAELIRRPRVINTKTIEVEGVLPYAIVEGYRVTSFVVDCEDLDAVESVSGVDLIPFISDHARSRRHDRKKPAFDFRRGSTFFDCQKALRHVTKRCPSVSFTYQSGSSGSSDLDRFVVDCIFWSDNYEEWMRDCNLLSPDVLDAACRLKHLRQKHYSLSLLHLACWAGDVDRVEFLLRLGADVNVVSSKRGGVKPVTLAAWKENWCLVKWLVERWGAKIGRAFHRKFWRHVDGSHGDGCVCGELQWSV